MQARTRRPAALLLLIAITASVNSFAAQQAVDLAANPALAWIKPLAEQGDARAQFLLGGFYSRGDGVPEDDELAAQWWRKAADQGQADAQNEFGVALYEGRGVRKNPSQAIDWYRKAAAQGLAIAQANIGVAYLDGVGVRTDPKQAVVWFRLAAQQNLAWAEFYLGEAYSRGKGVSRDVAKAMEWYRKAAEQDYPLAQRAMGLIYFRDSTNSVRRDLPSAVYWFARAARLGDDAAVQSLDRIEVSLPKVRLGGGVEVHGKPDLNAAVIKRAADPEVAYQLSRLDDWVQVYFKDGYTVGYINKAHLDLR